MKKLQVKTNNGWEWVFCNKHGTIVTCEDKEKALPQKAMWAEDDLKWFSSKFGNSEFRLD